MKKKTKKLTKKEATRVLVEFVKEVREDDILQTEAWPVIEEALRTLE
jgi:hypothetical protein